MNWKNRLNNIQRASLWILLITAVIPVVNAENARHVEFPKPRNATFGSSVTFNASCVYCDDFAWKFNELYQDDPTIADLHAQVTTRSSDRPDSAYDSITIRSTLRLLARREGTITSVAVSHSGKSDVSPGVVLLVQGAVDPPMLVNVTSLNNSTYFKLSWPPSFTLEHTDINYCVCNNATNACVNTTDTSVTSIVMCSPVLYQVSACNSVGCSENTTVIHPQDTVQFSLLGQEFLYCNTNATVLLDIVNNGNCSGTYSIELEYCSGGTEGSTRIDHVMPVEKGRSDGIYLTQPDILVNAYYTGSIQSGRLTQPFVFSTFDVQDVTATYTSEQDGYGNILVTCVFARGTRARGCIVVFRNGPTTRKITILRSEEHSPTEASGILYHLPDGEYEVMAYDLDFDDGTVVTNCELAHRVFMFPPPAAPSLMPPTTPPTVNTTGGSSEDSVSVIVGVVAAVLALVLVAVLVAVLVVVLLKRNARRKMSRDLSNIEDGLSSQGETPSQVQGLMTEGGSSSVDQISLAPHQKPKQEVGGNEATTPLCGTHNWPIRSQQPRTSITRGNEATDVAVKIELDDPPTDYPKSFCGPNDNAEGPGTQADDGQQNTTALPELLALETVASCSTN